MTAEPRVFVDTNIIFYSLDTDAGDKNTRARDLIEQLWSSRSGAISTQVLSELAVNLRRKRDLPWREVAAVVESYLAWPTVPLESFDTLEAIRIADIQRIGYWDALILRAAIKSGASTLLTEDLNHGQIIEQIEIVDPFHA